MLIFIRRIVDSYAEASLWITRNVLHDVYVKKEKENKNIILLLSVRF